MKAISWRKLLPALIVAVTVMTLFMPFNTMIETGTYRLTTSHVVGGVAAIIGGIAAIFVMSFVIPWLRGGNRGSRNW